MQVPSFGETFNVQSRPNATPAQSVGSSFWSKSRHQIKSQCDTSTKCRFQVCGWGLDLGGPVSRFRGFIEYRTLRRSEQVFCAESPPDAPECAFWCQSFSPRLFFKASGTYSDRALDLSKSFAICSGWLYSHFGMAVPRSCGGCPHFGMAVLLFWDPWNCLSYLLSHCSLLKLNSYFTRSGFRRPFEEVSHAPAFHVCKTMLGEPKNQIDSDKPEILDQHRCSCHTCHCKT